MGRSWSVLLRSEKVALGIEDQCAVVEGASNVLNSHTKRIDRSICDEEKCDSNV